MERKDSSGAELRIFQKRGDLISPSDVVRSRRSEGTTTEFVVKSGERRVKSV